MIKGVNLTALNTCQAGHNYFIRATATRLPAMGQVIEIPSLDGLYYVVEVIEIGEQKVAVYLDRPLTSTLIAGHSFYGLPKIAEPMVRFMSDDDFDRALEDWELGGEG